ncbi:MAG: hypothetical protein RIS44_2567 [Pseudomonadota bacterium]|jgi:hypothetical protein
MHKSEVNANPFALMMNPEAVVAAMNRSERLRRLTSHVCRPLDKPTPLKPLVGTSAAVEAKLDATLADDHPVNHH